jgi:hypothetical protein
MYLLIIFYNIRYYTYLVSAVIEKKPTTEVYIKKSEIFNMKLTVTDILAMFPIAPANMPTIGTDQQPPTHHSIKTFKDKLYLQAIAIPTQEGDTTLGHIYQVLTDAEYIEISDTKRAFPIPDNPGVTPAPPMHTSIEEEDDPDNEEAEPILTEVTTIIAKPSAAAYADATRKHDMKINAYNIHRNTETQLLNMIINSVAETYIQELEHPITKYSKIKPLDLLKHLEKEYGTISSDALAENYKLMISPWHSPMSIESMFHRLEKCREFAKQGGETIDDAHVMRIALGLISDTDLYRTPVKTWKTEHTDTATYKKLKQFFTKHARYLAENPTQAGLTTSTAGLANAVHTTPNIQEQVIHAMDSYLLDYQEPKQETNIAPSANAVTTNDDIKALLLAIQNSNSNNNSTSTRSSTNNNNSNRSKTKSTSTKLPAQGLDDNGLPITYCWTHGITHNLQHTSKTCQRPAENHKEAATLTNKLGGSTNKCAPRTTTTTNTRA